MIERPHTPADQRPTFTIVLRPLPQCADAIRALRRLLKYGLRACGLKCVDIKQGDLPCEHEG